jgi:hypothetical protein
MDKVSTKRGVKFVKPVEPLVLADKSMIENGHFESHNRRNPFQ